MPTYAENAHRREIRERRVKQDRRDAARHAAFDLQAQDRTPKSARHHFAVVGEGSRSSQEAYRMGWNRTFGRSA